MIRKKTWKRDFCGRNHTIMTGFRHKQTQTPLVLSNKVDQRGLTALGVIAYQHKGKAHLNYKRGHQGIPYLEKNFFVLLDEKKKTSC
jgi:hypothetical protein